MSDTVHLSPQLCMRRDDLNDLPPVRLPEGYSLRTSREGDAPYWVKIINEAFGVDWSEETFRESMIAHPAYRPDRIFFICDGDGSPCATASAYRMAPWGDETGYVHWVAVRPGHRGKKLGYWVSLAVLHKLKEEGCREAVLQTDDYRLPAIKLYLDLGFRPLIVDANQPEHWQKVLTALGRSE